MTIKQLIQTIDQAESLREISTAYTEIAANKLKQIRDIVEKNRNFLNELGVVYKVVKQIAKRRKLLPKKNNKSVSLLITSNSHFFGNVNQDLTAYFVKAMREGQNDQIVIGKTGEEYLISINYQLPYQQTILAHEYPQIGELDSLVGKIKDYSRIWVFYAKMRTVMSQIPTFEDITQTSYLKEGPEDERNTKKLFIFEPELAKILDFFETQVMNLLLQQSFLESELSRTAARLVSMDQAQLNADKFILQQEILLNKARKSESNTRLLETYASIILERRKYG